MPYQQPSEDAYRAWVAEGNYKYDPANTNSMDSSATSNSPWIQFLHATNQYAPYLAAQQSASGAAQPQPDAAPTPVPNPPAATVNEASSYPTGDSSSGATSVQRGPGRMVSHEPSPPLAGLQAANQLSSGSPTFMGMQQAAQQSPALGTAPTSPTATPEAQPPANTNQVSRLGRRPKPNRPAPPIQGLQSAGPSPLY